MKASEPDFYQYEEEFRDTLATVDEKGKRVWIYPKKPAGYYHNLRRAVTVFLLTLFFAGPFLHWQGRPFLLFNIFERRFILFGQVFWPQDFFLLALTLITFFVFVILFTVAFGRLWCGWACPQTLFMEMVFRKIEYWIEGDANAQRRLNSSNWTREKILKKTAKQVIFVLISLVISHTTMAYLIGLDQVKEIVTQSPAAHLAGFVGLLVFTGIFYGVFAWFREQACIAVCPYGRLQGVLLVKDSLVVAYDWLRGEPRGKLKKNQLTVADKQGDCIDCKLCVHVCPTGIDIRNGTQLECVNCTACMDACDEVMLKISKPKGLIRYSSYNAISRGTQKLFTPRVAGYAVVLTALVSLLSYFVFTRADIETTILKVPGTLYTKTDDGQITNLYSIEFLNKTFNDIELTVKIESPAQATFMKIGDPAMVVPKEGILKGMIMIKLPEEFISAAKTEIELGIYQGAKKVETARARFIGPIKFKPKQVN
ncbi:MAG: cytochrome c oxidase accessory protein CcoG [Cyclobacteriaceae bacterium]|nr:cytochrome c oxidase accessory protein CcoG [Cyclobacteriaceae bacterium]